MVVRCANGGWWHVLGTMDEDPVKT